MDILNDIQIENFDLYFAGMVEHITSEQKALLPHELCIKLMTRKRRGDYHLMPFIQKFQILSTCFGTELFITVAGKEGMSIKDFEAHKKQIKLRQPSQEQANILVDKDHFIFGNKELIDWMAYLNVLSVGPAYNYATRIRNTSKITSPDIRGKLLYFVNLLIYYETNRITMARETGFNFSEFYLLFYFYDGKEKGATETFRNVFKRARGSTKQAMYFAFKRLAYTGHLVVTGKARRTLYCITSLGRDAVNKIIKKYIIP